MHTPFLKDIFAISNLELEDSFGLLGQIRILGNTVLDFSKYYITLQGLQKKI